MKKILIMMMSFLAITVLIVQFGACAKPDKKDLWSGATYLEDTVLGNGSKTVSVELIAEGKSVVFTVKTDMENLGDALNEFGLLVCKDGQPGYYITVNGITADYDVDQSYWAFYVGNEYATAGMDQTPVNDGDAFRLVYTK